MRPSIVAELTKEVLGPRYGPYEELKDSPRSEYITGILAPHGVNIDREAEADELLGDTRVVEEAQDDPSITTYPHFSAILNPQKQPNSIGLSFVVGSISNIDPRISICATWARYEEKSGNVKPDRVWTRIPRYLIVKNLVLTQDMNEIITPAHAPATSLSNAQEDKMSIRVSTKKLQQGALLVKVFLCNDEKVSDDTNTQENRVPIGLFIFQPQIRIKCETGTELKPFIPYLKPLYGDEEDQMLSLLYRENPVMARGHMCATVWKDVDPEMYADSNTESKRPRSPPFYWVDGDILPPDLASEFRNSDVRTEFVPIYNVTLPDLDWDSICSEVRSRPVLDAGKLAETWDANQMRESLEPLVSEYLGWIEHQEDRIRELPQDMINIAHRNMEKHRIAIKRIRESIDIIASDDDARLAFCFMNKAMDVQYRWRSRIVGNEQGLTWFPFQIAFILLNISSVVKEDGRFLDLLWVPTGTGKTEAYLGLAVFSMAYRRRRALKRRECTGGVSIIMRYTLRLLTIQQFRRALRVITACEYLRVYGLENRLVGWRPSSCPVNDNFLWGSARFSIGLWVGGEMAPNALQSTGTFVDGKEVRYLGAIDILKSSGNHVNVKGEPAQIINCPCCNALLAIPEFGRESRSYGLEKGLHLHLTFSTQGTIGSPLQKDLFKNGSISVERAELTLIASHPNLNYYTISFVLNISSFIDAAALDKWWEQHVKIVLEEQAGKPINLECARPSRPGYFLKKFIYNGKEHYYDFEILCPNPSCELNRHSWCEGAPEGFEEERLPKASDFNRWAPVPEQFRDINKSCVSLRMPIPAYTVDDQVYHRCPTIIVSTVDKFARLPFEPRAGSIFGNIDRYHIYYGYYRREIPPRDCESSSGKPPKILTDPRPAKSSYIADVRPFRPPELIIQDELHLIEGPLGSLVGMYETAIDTLCSRGNRKVKYIASTATIRKASDQVKATFLRELFIFPPPGLSAKDSFYLRERSVHPLDDRFAGRLYVGICAPGKGAQTPIIRIWALLLQYVYSLRKSAASEDLDPYWTVVGYFNAIRELAGVTSLYKQDIVERLKDLYDRYGCARIFSDYIELSSRIGSTALPAYLNVLERKSLSRDPPSEIPDAILTTSIFGVGVDIPRLGLMVVHGQPKTTSAYIQATGRIGRLKPGIAITFYKITRPRDLSHYEFFIGYHSMLHRFVEPITVFPFATRVRERAEGPVMVSLLRCAAEIGGVNVSSEWAKEQELRGGSYSSGARHMADHRHDVDVRATLETVKERAGGQPKFRVPNLSKLEEELKSGLDRWSLAARGGRIIYWYRRPQGQTSYHRVLGDSLADRNDSNVVFGNAPQSLRDIEETIALEVP